jgi:hypothetical protein
MGPETEQPARKENRKYFSKFFVEVYWRKIDLYDEQTAGTRIFFIVYTGVTDPDPDSLWVLYPDPGEQKMMLK